MGVNIEGSPPHTQFVCASAHAGKGRKEEKDRRCTPLTLRGNYDRFIQDMYVKRERAHDDDEKATGREKEFPTPLSSGGGGGGETRGGINPSFSFSPPPFHFLI